LSLNFLGISVFCAMFVLTKISQNYLKNKN
jgi:hypothetical protein